MESLFLEKAFQLIVPMPNIPTYYKETYWTKLLNIRVKGETARLESGLFNEKARLTLQNIQTEEEILNELRKATTEDKMESLAFREEAIKRLVVKKLIYIQSIFFGILDHYSKITHEE